MNLQGAKCLITGGSRGIGKAIAIKFARLGATCNIIGRNESALQDAVAELRSVVTTVSTKRSIRPSHEYNIGDVSQLAFWRDFSNSYKDEIDILVNAAGTSHSSLLVRTAPEIIQSIVETNLMGSTWACRFVSKLMLSKRRIADDQGPIQRPSACIVNVSSLLGVQGGRGSAAYAASKAGVIGLTRALAAELGPLGIRVNCIVPGYINTDMTDGMPKNARDRAIAGVPLGRFGSAEEVAQAAEFLVSNGYANNCHVNIDGGLSASIEAPYSGVNA